MRVFSLGKTQMLGEHVAHKMDVGLDPIEERDFPGGEHKSRPLVSVRNEDAYVTESLNSTERMSPAERLVRLLFFLPRLQTSCFQPRVSTGSWSATRLHHSPLNSRSNNKLETVSCARLLAETIKRLHGGGSIHRLLTPTQ